MKSLMIGAATALALMAAPAFAADSNSISGSPAAKSAGSTTNSNQANPPCTSNNQLGCGGMGGVDSNSSGTSGSSGSTTGSGSMTGSGSSSSTNGTGGNSLGNSGSMGTGSDGPVGTQQPSGSMGGSSSSGTGSTVR